MSITARRQRLVVTAVPRGRTDGGQWEYGVHLSPRLSFDGAGRTPLESFADWTSWPSVPKHYYVSLDGAKTWQPLPETSVRFATDPAMWRAIFHKDLMVVSHTGDPGPARRFGGYSYATLADGLKEVYDKDVPFLQSALGTAARSRELQQKLSYDGLLEPLTTPLGALLQHDAFYRPYHSQPKPRIDDDFHARLATLNDHSALMARLGLIGRVYVDTGELTPTSIAVKVTWDHEPKVGTIVLTPVTRTGSATAVGGAEMVPALRDPGAAEYDEGLRLRLDEPDYFVLHDGLDVDLAAARVVQVAQKRVGPGEDLEITPPAPATTGMTLTRSGRAPVVSSRVKRGRMAALQMLASTPSLPTMFAEDLIAGHAFQVKRVDPGAGEFSPWLSLTYRKVTYRATLPSGKVVKFSAVDEAPVSLAARRAGAANGADLLVSDVVARWDGWSLAVPRPSRTLLEAHGKGPRMDTARERHDDTYLTIEPAFTDLAPDGSYARLPVLRYGASYRWRARVVDITGFTYPWGDEPLSPVVTYHRYEPAGAPLVLAPASLTPGETGRRVVVRSTDGATREVPVWSSRALVPPRVSAETVIRHGMVDVGGAPSRDRYETLAAADAVLVPKHAPATDATAPAGVPVRWLADPMVTQVHLDLPGGGQRDVDFVPDPAGDPLGESSLADWQSVGVFVVPGTSSTPSLSAVEEHDGSRVVRVTLPQAMRTTMLVRAQPRAPRILENGIAAMQDIIESEQVSQTRQGRIPTLTPTVEIELVHAVRAPLADPATTAPIVVDRGQGRKDADLTLPLSYESASTGRLTARATWDERVDDGPALKQSKAFSRPSVREGVKAVLGEIELVPARKRTSTTMSWDLQAAFADLRRRDLTIDVRATSSFVPEFRRTLKTVFAELPAGSGHHYLSLPSDVDLESVLVLHAGREGSPYTRGTDWWVAIAPGETEPRIRLRDGLKASLVVVQGVRGSVTADMVSEHVTVPSAVRPAPPQPVYAVPAFAIQEGFIGGDATARASRGGNRVRIWLERPWWTSGDHEKLALITALSGGDVSQDHESLLARRITTFGRDPLTLVGSWLGSTQVPVTGTPISEVALDEPDLPPVTVDIHTYDVAYDHDRDLYYADIEFQDQPGPMFVRMAIARYQEATVSGVPHLSRVVTMDPVELLPRRSASATRTSDTELTVTVDGVGQGLAAGLQPMLQVHLQQRDGSLRGDLGWRTVSRKVELVSDSGPTAAGGVGYAPVVLAYPSDTGMDHRILVEEFHVMTTRDGNGNALPPLSPKNPTKAAQAILDLVALRPLWVATLPMPDGSPGGPPPPPPT